MNKIIVNLLLIVTVMLAITSCKKEENRVIFEGGTAPVLSVSSQSPLVFLESQKSKPAVTFNWTNPNYMFNTGVSSQNVTYIMEVDKKGANFSGPTKQEVSFTSDLSKTFTVQELNTILTKMDLEDGVAHDLEFRLRSVLGNTDPVYSNSVGLKLTPYLDVAVPIPPTNELYITGDATASGWTNDPPANQKFTAKSKTEYTITTNLSGGKYIKFLTSPGKWQPQYGMVKDNPGVIGYNMGTGNDPEAILIDKDGTYVVTVNFKTGRYTVVKQ